MKTVPILLAAAAMLAAGCSEVHTRTLPNAADLRRYGSVFVEHRLADGRDLDVIMAQELRDLGYNATSGPLTMMPPEAEVIVSYEDQWTWDFNTYLLALNVSVRNSRNDKILAAARVFKPSNVFGSPPEKMIREALRKLFLPRPGGVSPPQP